ncbi:MAG: endonuclease/exonuclease/phosphatase family protein [Bacteroidia bacterium]
MVFLFILCSGFLPAKAQVPSFGSDDRIDLGSWNLMWYGHPVYGSTNKALQRGAIGEVLRNTRIDIWFFQEICDTGDFSALLRDCGPFQHVYASYWQSQKTALVWDSTQWTLIYDSMLFKNVPQDFANGRLPLLTVLKGKYSSDTLFLLGVHLKANIGNDVQKEEAWKNRKAAAGHLLDWKEQLHDRKVIIAGDWNDGIDKSIFKDTISPFSQLRNEGLFLLEKQALAGERSWYFGTTCIDHIWTNPVATGIYKKNTSQILPLDWYFDNYPTEVSDHFPVFAAFNGGETTGEAGRKNSLYPIWPNPSEGMFYMDGNKEQSLVRVVDLLGKEVTFDKEVVGDKVRIHIPKQGIYSLFLYYGGQVFVYRLVVNP